MNASAIQLNEKLFRVPFETTKDKVISIRIEESLFSLLVDLSKELHVQSVSETVRKIIYFYLLNAIYEEEWKNLHSKNFESFINKVAEAGSQVELNNYKNLLQELSEYVVLMRAVVDRINASAGFFEGETDKLEEVTGKLEKAKIVWRK
jgi:hypothetical protein